MSFDNQDRRAFYSKASQEDAVRLCKSAGYVPVAVTFNKKRQYVVFGRKQRLNI